MAVARWYDGLEPVTVPVPCDGVTHRVTWRRGNLVLEDHGNLTAEQALVALGGAACQCLQVLDAWSVGPPRSGALARYSEVMRMWPTLSRPPERVTLPTLVRLGFDPRRQRWLEAQDARLRMEHVLLWLPDDLAARWMLGALAGFERRYAGLKPMERLDLELVLGAASRVALARGLRSWHRLRRAQPVSIACRLAPPGTRPALAGRVDQWRADIGVDLPLSWLWRVWARGPVLVDGCFVLDVEGDEARVVRWDRTAPGVIEAVTVPARLRRDGDGEGHLRWA
ncbi:MAG: hypothetical protein ACRD1K_02745 [Acidimicrobiales bacterium]